MGNKYIKAPLEERFWNKVSIGRHCWKWNGATTKKRKGYGVIKINGKDRILTHRLSWELHYGIIPDGMKVLHTCDNSLCVNPQHLFIGTQADNVADMVKKGRLVINRLKGINHPKAKLNSQDIVEIRKDQRPQSQIAKDYNVSQATISCVKNNLRYKEIK
ncbi:HNH endonuclease [Candidatus Pacearchaeota archaeon]|nr:HNH endonuclease [Candidatus Pacearchaeota archaeon]